MPSPPPPYSPSVQQTLSQAARASPLMGSNGLSPATTISPSVSSPEYRTPVSAATTVSPAPFSNTEPRSGPYVRSVSSSSPQVTSTPTFPPPPPKAGRDRSSSRSKTERPNNFFGLSALSSRSRNNAVASSSSSTSQPQGPNRTSNKPSRTNPASQQ